MSRIDWEELRRRAVAEYERSGEGHRRREAGSQAAAQAEELAWWARHRPDTAPVALGGGRAGADPDAVLATALAADQSVYVYHGEVMLAHLEPSTIYEPYATPAGLALRTLLRRRDGSFMRGPEWAAGEWTFCGRGHPGE